MLFGLNGAGVPSVAAVVQVRIATSAPPPPPLQGAMRYVRFVAESEVNGKPWTSVAELNVLDANGNALDRSGWNLTADSVEVNSEDGAARNAIDGDPASIWHTDWSSVAGDANDPGHPHELIIDLGDGS